LQNADTQPAPLASTPCYVIIGAVERSGAAIVNACVTNDDKTAAAVLSAFNEARGAGLESPECYRAGVDVWRRRHPAHTPGYAAKQAVAVILAALGPELLKIE
jgi:hypothetical protein